MRCVNSTLLCIPWPQILYMFTLSTYDLSIFNAFNAIYVKAVDTKTHPHISAHNFLNIQPIFNLQKVLKS